MKTRTLCTICARGGSKGVENKNISLFAGKPLIAWTIEQAIAWGKADKVIVSTDSETIAEIAKQYGAEVPFTRPAHLATDSAAKLPVIQHALSFMEKNSTVTYDYVLDLDPTSPLRDVSDIDLAFRKLVENQEANNLYSVCPAAKSPYFNMVELSAEGYSSLSKNLPDKITRRQDSPPVYAMNASIYVYRRNYLAKATSIHSPNTIIYNMPQERSYDIDSPTDFVIAETIMKEKKPLSADGYMKYKNLFDMTGKVVVVTGAAGLLGGQMVKGLLEYGATVIAADVAYDKNCRLLSPNKSMLQKVYIDITDNQVVENLVDSLPKIDVWINNAYPRTEDWSVQFETVPYESFRKNVDMHLNGYFLCCQSVAKKMVEQQEGVIINMGSIYGLVGPDFSIYEGTEMTNPVAYSAIKGGIINMTRYMAAYLGKYNIRVNALCPGGVHDNQDQGFVEAYKRKTPLGRMAEAEDIVGPILFLSSEASSYMTGHVLTVDGGWTVC